MSLLDLLMQQQPAIGRPSLPSMPSGLDEPAPAPEPQEEDIGELLVKAGLVKHKTDEVEPMAASILRGFLNQSSMTGELPSVQEFDKRYRQSVSPAREVLSNMMYGISSSMLGTKFLSNREQKYNEWLDDVKIKMEQQKQQRQWAQSVMQQAGEIYRQNQAQQFQTDVHNATAGQKAEEFKLKYGVDVAQFKLAVKQYEAHVAQLQEQQRHNLATEGKISDPNYQQAMQEVLSQYQARQMNPYADVKALPKFLTDVASRKHQLDTLEAQAKERPEKPPRAMVFIPTGQGTYAATEIRPGMTVPGGAVTAQGMNTMNVPTQSSRTMAEMARTVVEQVPDLIRQVDELGKKVGPGAGRWNEMWINRAGMNDPAFAGLDQDLDLFASALVRTHFGARGGQDYRIALRKNFTMAQSPDDLKARILHADKWLTGYGNIDKSHPVPTGKIRMIFPTGDVIDVDKKDEREAIVRKGAMRAGVQ